MKMSSKPMPISVRIVRTLDQPQRGSEDDRAGAFAAHQRAGDVEAGLRQKLVEVEAGDAAGDAGILCADEIGIAYRGGV